MGLSLGKSIALCGCTSLFLICSCEKHELGEYPNVQRELPDLGKSPAVAEPTSASPSPAAKATPADFFPTKP
jgi:hypothetical protein